MNADDFWVKYKKENNLPSTLKYNGELCFGEDSKSNKQMSALVLSGIKKATCTLFESYALDMINLPKIGDYYILTDTKDQAICVIKNVNVSIMAFNQMYWELAKKEGEASSMDEWQDIHFELFEEEAIDLGIEFTKSSLIVFEEFEVVG